MLEFLAVLGEVVYCVVNRYAESDAEYNTLEVYVSFLRKKLAFIGSRVKIRATRGVGYSLEDEK